MPKHGFDPIVFAAGKVAKKAAKDAAKGKGWSTLKASDKDALLKELVTEAGLIG